MSGNSPAAEHPLVPVVEQILSDAALRTAPVSGATARGTARYAVWFCVCMADEDAPNWLIHATESGAVWWSRLPDGQAVEEVADAREIVGDHVAPEDVLAWLRGDESGSWPADVRGGADLIALREISRLIRG